MFYGDTESQTRAKFSTQKKVDIYFRSKESYKILEQIVSCAPILISIPLLVAFSYHQISVNEVAIGSLVAVLPRSLQLFQNIHSASMSISQILLLKNKIAKIYSFSSTLTGYDYLSSINHSKISVTNTRDNKKNKNK